jgi:tetratricopeptide (TPR) repeat protein
MQYSSDQFRPGEAWLTFRVDCLVADNPVDVYLLIDLASTYIFGVAIAQEELPDEKEVHNLMQKGYKTKKAWPKVFFCPKNDPAEKIFRKQTEGKGITFQVEPLSAFQGITLPLKKSFYESMATRLGKPRAYDGDTSLTDEDKLAEAFIPDSYDLCPCASGKKYKFCCKPILREITMAMADAEEGHIQEAIKWMDRAKEKAGETAEVLCRYAIVYTFFDRVRSEKYLKRCLHLAPNHPRANYIKGIDLKEKGDIQGAIKAYKTALEHYPATDRYHLNETWNNLGTAYYAMGKYFEAKAAWETAINYLPEDPTAKANLNEFFYENPDIPEEIKGPRIIH